MRERGRPDTLLLGATLVLVGFGLVMVHSASLVFAADPPGQFNLVTIGRYLQRALPIILVPPRG